MVRTPSLYTAELDSLVGDLLAQDPTLGVPRIGLKLRERGLKVAKDRLTASVQRVKLARGFGPSSGTSKLLALIARAPEHADLLREAVALGRELSESERDRDRKPQRQDLADYRVEILVNRLVDKANRFANSKPEWAARTRTTATRLRALRQERAALLDELRELCFDFSGHLLKEP